MFRKDFETGKFPISKRSPVIGFHKGVPVAAAAYNRKELKELANIPDIQLIGVWPGKMNTDLFYIDPAYYKDLLIPPVGHEDIDSAEFISVFYNDARTFDHIEYRLPEQTFFIICKEQSLLDYLRKSNIRHTVVIQKI